MSAHVPGDSVTDWCQEPERFQHLPEMRFLCRPHGQDFCPRWHRRCAYYDNVKHAVVLCRCISIYNLVGARFATVSGPGAEAIPCHQYVAVPAEDRALDKYMSPCDRNRY